MLQGPFHKSGGAVRGHSFSTLTSDSLFLTWSFLATSCHVILKNWGAEATCLLLSSGLSVDLFRIPSKLYAGRVKATVRANVSRELAMLLSLCSNAAFSKHLLKEKQFLQRWGN